MEDRAAFAAAARHAGMELGLFCELIVPEGFPQARRHTLECDGAQAILRALEQLHAAKTNREYVELPLAAQQREQRGDVGARIDDDQLLKCQRQPVDTE